MTEEQLLFQVSPASATSSTSPGISSTESTNTSLSTHALDTSYPCLPKIESSTGSSDSSIAPSKTDKPRPHVCGTCARSFARLEHLKRHERSHTKEKPFECPECTRCFARRDLLLRHQQKLHLTPAPARAKAARRESTSGVSTASKVRKSSVAGNAVNSNGSLRPRANTISHIDGSALEYVAANGSPMRFPGTVLGQSLAQQVNLKGPGVDGLRIDTSGPAVRSRGAPKSAVEALSIPSDMAMGGLFNVDEHLHTGSTVNPAQLHLEDSMITPYPDEFDWMRGHFANGNYNTGNEHAIEASPLSVGHDSPMINNDLGHFGQMSVSSWNNEMYLPEVAENDAMNVAFGQKLSIQHQSMQNGLDHPYPTPPPGTSLSPTIPLTAFGGFPPPLPFTPMTSAPTLADVNFSAITSPAVGSITEVTRQALIISLSRHSLYGNNNRRFSMSSVPLSPHDSKSSVSTSALPSTEHLQRYIGAYIQYFHPHCPFLHIPTLSFDSPAYTNNLGPANYGGYSTGGIVGGGGCLILAMAAVGALYEFDKAASKELFEAGKKLIQQYLEERRKVDIAAASNNIRSAEQNTPLWLVQAMLLNVVYGHQCGEKITGDIASTHCAALVSLARAAGLLNPARGSSGSHGNYMTEIDPWTGILQEDAQTQWHHWAVDEERNRTLFALFHMSSLLVSGYNHAPSIMNSEIHLDLPCEEDLWSADTASLWAERGGAISAKQRAVSFSTALSMLLTASHQQHYHPFTFNPQFSNTMSAPDMPQPQLQPSTFGCLVLIDALHNYVWETRQRHSGRTWTTQETEAMQAHMEPALRAWQSAWQSNPTHSLERPNPYGMGPLSADSIPLLDLAYVRLFVNLGVSKEAFWQRNFDLMAEELARGADIITHAVHSENQSSANPASVSRKASNGGLLDASEPREEDMTVPPLAFVEQQTKASKRERHLRKAAFYAADSLSMSDRLGVTFADFTSRELPIQSAMCTFDCAQVLAEWVATVQERTGRYLGVLGQSTIDFSQVPAILLLEEEDCKLLDKVRDILNKAEAKMSIEIPKMNAESAMVAMNSLPSWSNAGYGSQILVMTAYNLKRAAVWPVTGLMAHGLEIQADHMNKRATASTAVVTPA